MKLKELRLNKKLSQKECANFLGLSLRSYQNYESDESKESSTKYQVLVNKLENYNIANNNDNNFNTKIDNSFYTCVTLKDDLMKYIKQVENFKHRSCFNILKQFVNTSYIDKVAILYGLRRTGKTTLMFQLMATLPLEKVAYIKLTRKDTMSNLSRDLNRLEKEGYDYVFIDEITLVSDFIDTAAILSDIYASMGMKIIISGTDSLGFMIATTDELYDRAILIHTSFIPYKEYERLLDIKSIDRYIEYGGTLQMESLSQFDSNLANQELSFLNQETTGAYIDSAIVSNIQNSLKNYHDGDYFYYLKDLYDAHELTNVVNRLVQNINHDFVLSVVTEKFKSQDLGSAKNLMLHEAPLDRAYILSEVNQEKITNQLKKIIQVKEKWECSIEVTPTHLTRLKYFLKLLDLIVDCPSYYEGIGFKEHIVFSQPGLRYSIAKALVYSLMQDSYFNSISIEDQTYIKNKILEDVKGKMLEDIVLLEVNKTLKENQKAFKYYFEQGGEYDMVITDEDSLTCSLFEIKHSDKINNNQTKHLVDKAKCDLMTFRFGKIKEKIVLYRGLTKEINDQGIKYINVEEYLRNL